MRVKFLVLVSTVAFLAACKTTPEPVVPEPVPVSQTVPTPAPVQQTAPPQIVQAPSTVPYTGPLPGSLEDFLYSSGGNGDGRVYFAYNQYDLSNDSRDVLRRQAQWLQSYPNVTAVLEGNADERGTREYNLALAARRAESVKSFLVSQGVSPNRLTTVSYGKERPIDGGSNEASWARNRNALTNLMSGSIG